MLRRFYWITVLLLLLSLPALACGVFGGDDAEATAVPDAAPAPVDESAPEPTAVPTTAPVDAAANEEPTDTEPVDEAPPLPESALSLNTINELPFNSYRITMVIDVTGTTPEGAEVIQGLNSEMAFSTDPQLMGIVMNFIGMDEQMGSGTIEMAQIDGVSYTVIPEMGCITTSSEDLFADNPFMEMVDPAAFMDDLNNPKYEGEETINGILTRHYSFDQFALMGSTADDIQTADGHVYIAKEGEYMVRMVVDATGQVDMFDSGMVDDGVFHMEINLTDTDEPVEVTIPEACAAQGSADSDLPMLDDATEITSFAGILNYKTALSLEDIVAFYDDALAADGWVKDEDGSFIASGNALISYTRDGKSLSLTVSPNDDGSGGNYVILVSEME